MENNKFLPKLSQNLLKILNDDKYYDITIEVGNDPYVKIFRSHMVILYYRSSYLRRILSTNKKENDGTLMHIKLPNILPKTFQHILRYIYGGKLSLEGYDISDIINILIAASELGLHQELIIYLQSFLIENKATWMEQNFDMIFQTSSENHLFLKLQKYCIDLVSKKPDKIFKSPNFSSISEKLLTSEEFLEKVLPYEKILPKELYKDLLKYFLSSNNQQIKKSESHITQEIEVIDSKDIDSKIITFKHAELILKWINTDNSNTFAPVFSRLIYKDTTMNKSSFKLLFRGSRDGFTPKKFHEICDNQSHTVTIIKVKDMKDNKILGGYNPIEWKSNKGFGSTKDSFIFSFKSKDNIESHILSRVVNESVAIWNNSNDGPSFGAGDLLYNFYDGTCSEASYEKAIRDFPIFSDKSDEFSVEECEVFLVSN